jgi:hypothetical protein
MVGKQVAMVRWGRQTRRGCAREVLQVWVLREWGREASRHRLTGRRRVWATRERVVGV